MNRILLSLIFILPFFLTANSQNRWKITDEGAIRWEISEKNIPHHDHIEMSGQQMSSVLRWRVNADQSFSLERSLIFPMLRTIPNDTHASLMHRISTDIPSLLSINGRTIQQEETQIVEIHGALKVVSKCSTQSKSQPRSRHDAEIILCRNILPSTDQPALCEIYTVKNNSGKAITLYIPEFSQVFKTLSERGVTGSYIIRSKISGYGTFILQPDQEQTFGVTYSANREGESEVNVSVEKEYQKRMSFVRNDIENALILETPDTIINAAFSFAKLRAAESIYKTKGGFMHGPGGEAYYAAIWANDQAEYINPFFPYLGYEIGNASALNAYQHFSRFMNEDFHPIPSSIIAEGTDIWDGAGDRGDAAMIAYGASRYALAKGNQVEAKTLWPLIEWCLEYCRQKVNGSGVVTSDSDELEGRFPSGDANLCTSSLYYDALNSAIYLGNELNIQKKQLQAYQNQANKLRQSIEKHFGKDLYGFHTYQYYKGNDLLRSWICMPLTVGINERSEGTIDALFSNYLWKKDGLLTQQGDSTFWDRSTLYALRGIYIAGQPDKATDYLHDYSERRLLDEHVPYPIEAYPEGSQRHLSAESGLYCRIITEGLFGIRPTGLHSFDLTPQLPENWENMTLRKIKAFDREFSILVEKQKNGKIKITIIQDRQKPIIYITKNGSTTKISLK